MAKLISPVRTQLLYRTAAYQLWKSSYGPMVPGLFNGYAVTCFESELQLRAQVQNKEYSELVKSCLWKVGTAEITETRLERMFKVRRPLNNFDDIWDRFMMPFNERLTKYAGDTKSLEAGRCAWMRNVLIQKYLDNEHVAILMIPLIIGYKGKASALEDQMSEMLDKHGAEVHNNKAEQKKKERGVTTEVSIGLDERKADKQLKLTPTLQQMGFEIHPEFQKQRKGKA
jgi:hypothetical protein